MEVSLVEVLLMEVSLALWWILRPGALQSLHQGGPPWGRSHGTGPL